MVLYQSMHITLLSLFSTPSSSLKINSKKVTKGKCFTFEPVSAAGHHEHQILFYAHISTHYLL